MVANSQGSARSARRSTGKGSADVVTPVDAAEILSSALAYCQQAGMAVSFINGTGRNAGKLLLVIPGLRVDGKEIVPVLATASESAGNSAGNVAESAGNEAASHE